MQGLTTTQVAGLTTLTLIDLTTTQISSLTTTQLAALTMEQTASLTTDDIHALTTTQLNAMLLSPLVLNLGDGGVQTKNIAAGVSFDMAATGKAVTTGWITGNEGFLVRDLNNNGVIDSGAEMFGTSTTLASGEKASTGFAALGALDSNHDGVINAKDDAFNSLAVWVDANGDGKVESGEMKSLTAMGIAQIGLATTTSPTADNGNVIGMEGSFVTTDGQTHSIADVWFQTNGSDSQMVDLSQLNPTTITAGSLNQIDLAAHGSQATLKVAAADIETFGTADGKGHVQIVVNGTDKDTVQVAGASKDWVSGGDTLINNVGYHVFSHGKDQLLVEDKINVAFLGTSSS